VGYKGIPAWMIIFGAVLLVLFLAPYDAAYVGTPVSIKSLPASKYMLTLRSSPIS
jgi:hypothetical protein